MKPIRIVIADDDIFEVEGLLRLLTDDTDEIEVVGTTVSVLEIEDLIQEAEPDVIVIDMAWPGDKKAGLKLIPKIWAKYETQVVAITAYPELVELAQKAGAYPLKKGFPLNDLINTIRWAAKGYKTPAFKDPQSDDAVYLTQRELEVVDKIASGLTDKQIALNLFITEGTVKKHVSSILGKLNANNRTEAAVIALRRNLL